MRRLVCPIAALAVLSCGGTRPVPRRPDPQPPVASAARPAPAPEVASAPWAPPDAADGVKDADLATLLREHWAWSMQQHPVWATQLGIHRFDDKLSDRSQAAIAARRKQRRTFLERAKAIAAHGDLGGVDRTTLELLSEDLESTIASEVCDSELWALSPVDNPVTEWNRLHEDHVVKTPGDAARLVARYKAIPTAVDQEIADLRAGAARGLYANAHSTKLVIEVVKRQLDQKLEDWPMLAPLKDAHADFPPEKLAAFKHDLEAAVTDGIRPALSRYHDFLEQQILPHARGKDAEGLGALPMGKACYLARIRAETSLPKTPEELHQTGETEMARINAEMEKLGQKLFHTNKLPVILAKLKSDKKLEFDNADQIVAKAEAALAAAKAKIPTWFGRLPKADCRVRRIPDYEAPFTTIAYYREPVPDGSRPGELFVNVYKPETRRRFEMEALAFHESIPGHHLQIAIAQELPALPAFRKNSGTTAYVEGWGLYAEHLADEMGLYSGDLDRMGMLSFEAWRAARLVVDTGIHSMGWTREKAVLYMRAHTALADNNIDNEVDRYVVWPAQALAYKTGQLEILALRKQAEDALGKRFDIRAFHDVVLGSGAVTLPVLRRQVEAWIAERQKG